MKKIQDSIVVGYLGRRGKGKSLTMVKDGYNYYLRGYDVFTNMKGLDYPHERVTEDELIEMAENDEFFNCVILFDEIQVLIDSRRSNREENVKFLHFVQQIRKRNCVLLFTTQFLIRVDKGVREHLDIIARPKIMFNEEGTEALCVVEYMDIVHQEEYGYLRTTKKVFYANEVFQLYDHKERAKSVKSKKEKEGVMA